MTSSISQPAPLNPAQQQVLDELGSTDRPTFRDDLRDHLRHELTESLTPIAEAIDEPPLFVSKRKLSMIHGCEARYRADQLADFEWSIPIARGTVAHKAIEILVARRGNPTALDLANDAMDRLELDERELGEFIRALDEGERAELVGQVNDYVATFIDTFPPLRRQWVPVAESRARAELCDDRIALSGMVDLSLGRARGNQAGKVLIDLKTGRPHPSHIDDLRFYALLETLKIGTPPRLLVSYYLDAGEPRREVVTEDLLWSTAKRTVDAVAKMVEIDLGRREPTRTPSGACRFCPIQSECTEGTRYLAEADE
jgi:RecB family exonuclease